ncbi:MAG: hypothetical protein WC356_05485 [Candidatus Micrarchaeia archaeon]|jgi:Arc/MetJ-type ribon-helix-helix transcriptional regulator
MTIVNVNLRGQLERFVEQYIEEGYATSKAEIIRVALTQYFEEKKKNRHKEINEDLKFTMNASEHSLKKIWDNEKEEKFWSRYY